MILQALHAYYYKLLEQDGDSVPKDGYSEAAVSFEIHLDTDGQVLDITSDTNPKGKTIKRSHKVPEQDKRSSNIYPYFLCDKGEYLFGGALGMRAGCRKALQILWREVLSYAAVDKAESLPELEALLRFVEWTEEELADQLHSRIPEETRTELTGGGLCILKYAPSGRFLHDNRTVQAAWERYLRRNESGADDTDPLQTCLVSGEQVPAGELARLHPNIKNVIGAQSSGAAVVSFNKESFVSYGKEQSYNAPTSKKAADAYGYVLNKLLAVPRHHVRMNDMTVVFWAHSELDHEQLFVASLMQEEPSGEDEVGRGQPPDPDSIRERVKSAVARVRSGQEFRDTFADLNPKTTYYVLGLSPNAARLSVRFFYRGTLGEVGEKVWQHYKDLSIVGLERTPTMRQLLRELAVGRDSSNIPPNMEGQLFRSILQGLPYSKSIFVQLMNRIRADADEPRKGLYKIGSVRAAMIKAYLLRVYRNKGQNTMEEDLTVAENIHSNNVAYNLGRLFACLEKAQTDALGRGINATIRDRFWGAASASPATVLPRLINLAQHHISKDEKWGSRNNKNIRDVVDLLPESLPSRLTLEEQGMFAIGYYQKQASFYSSTKGVDKTDEIGDAAKDETS
ncbi:type I-C CRISPR-associated protein Cas8c/Csd1 [Paenibacillus pasadenensis]|uniref:type I-C CRISPR-associated protein Cas8c/Csd1 n=1 Tax=Paenibacillus pasadenensis TaxID=217090 RepID=UPI00203FDD2B|nr:type I-C CRISPR-associated protein Cas8c/Csd1 [Paenibacillus pasadenensis]MCM3748408.1 type I-C CRISPR-associated protein Cas8c/Csd1 [Paenibacillus pasadenensis]